MPSVVPFAPERSPRRARYLVPLGTPRRGEVLAAVAAAAVAAAALFVPLTLLLAAAFHAVSRVTRWRPLWLWVPAAGGVVAVLATGFRPAAAGFGRGPAAAAAALSGLAADPAALARLPAVVARGLGGQFPLAMILAAAAAAGAWWVRWLHTDEWDMPAPRLGLVGAVRRNRTVASVRAGRVVTRDGACLGVDEATGRPAALSWRDAGGGVLVTGAAPPAVLASGLQLAHAAIRRRRPVIVVDLPGHAELPGAIAALCGAARAPLHCFGVPDGARYEPRVRPGEVQRAALRAAGWEPGPGPGARAGLDEVVRQRGVALFCLDRLEASAAGVLAGLVAADVAAIYTDLDRKGVAPDGLCWFTECAGTDPAALVGLVAAGSPAGLTPVLATTWPATAAELARQVSAGVFHRLADRDLAAELAPLTGTTVAPVSRVMVPDTGEDGYPAPQRAQADSGVPLGTMVVPVVPGHALCALPDGDFVLVTGLTAVRAGAGRHGMTVRARCRAVTGRIPPWPAPPGPPARRRPA
jgi:hypothetical protein